MLLRFPAVDIADTINKMLRFKKNNIFDCEAKRVSRENIKGSIASFGDACAILRTKFHSVTWENRVRKLLQILRLESIMQTKHCSIPEALEEMRDTITKNTPQGPRNHQSDLNPEEYLHDAFVENGQSLLSPKALLQPLHEISSNYIVVQTLCTPYFRSLIIAFINVQYLH